MYHIENIPTDVEQHRPRLALGWMTVSLRVYSAAEGINGDVYWRAEVVR